MIKIAIVLPVYQHGNELINTLAKLVVYQLPIFVINDGSDPEESKIIQDTCEKNAVQLYEREKNGGKGKAVIDGLKLAKKNGFSHVFQIDADGQHDFSKIPQFIQVCELKPDYLVLGCPQFDRSVPRSRKAGRWMTHIWVWINSLSFRVKDSMCGFRVYPLNTILNVIDKSKIGHYMEFDVEICVRSCWVDIPVINIPVGVIYPEGGRSNFRLKEDNLLLTMMHTRLFFGMLLRSPALLANRFYRIFNRQA